MRATIFPITWSTWSVAIATAGSMHAGDQVARWEIWILNVLFNAEENGTDDIHPGSKVHGANMGLIWGRQDPGGPHVSPMNYLGRYIWANGRTRVAPPRSHNAIYHVRLEIDSPLPILTSVLFDATLGYSWGVYSCESHKYCPLVISQDELFNTSIYAGTFQEIIPKLGYLKYE